MSTIFEQLTDNGISVEENESGQWMFFRGTETDDVVYDDCFVCAYAAHEFFGLDEVDEPEEREDYFRDDVEADADVLASIGWGTDEDYGYYGDGEY